MGRRGINKWATQTGGSDGEESACNTADLDLIPRSGMATHSSILAWRIPWTEAPGGLQSMGPQREWLSGSVNFHVYESESESHSAVSNSAAPWTIYSPWNSPVGNTGMSSRSLLQGIFTTQGLNPGLLHCRRIPYQLSHKGSPRILEWVPIPPPADLPDPGIEPGSLALQVDSLPKELSGSS